MGVVGTMETAPLDVHLPMDMPFDHMKNIYVAIATLAAALLIFIVVVSLKGQWVAAEGGVGTRCSFRPKIYVSVGCQEKHY